MSVQAGVWNFDGAPVDREFLTRTSQAVAEYGPDGEAFYVEGCVGMLYRPFHTTSESRLELQPLRFAGGMVATWDGRLDNRDDLIAELCDELTDDRTDAAIVGTAFEKWNTDSFAKLIGDWAVAIWARHENTLILARDYAGIRSLYYSPLPKKIIWCSHLAPIALSGQPFSLCDEYVASYLALRFPGDLTPYREIHSVPPGGFVRIRNETVAVHRYWSFDPRVRTRYKTDEEYEEHFRYVFRQSVRRRLRSDSPILTDLSGGLDSSSIVCVADDILAKEHADAPSIDTLSYSFPDEPEADDFLYFVKVEEKRGRTGHHADIRGSGDSFSLEYPSFRAVPTIGARTEVETTRSDVVKSGKYRVTISGFGGDEILAQVLDPRVQMADLLVRLRLAEFVKQLGAWSLLTRRPWIQLLFETLLLLLPTPIRARATEAAKVEKWVNSRFAREYGLSTLLLQAAEGSWSWLPSARDCLQTHSTIVGLLMNTSSPSVDEKRYPYLDQTLTEFIRSIPTDQLLRPGDRRSLMRRALVDIVPKEILARQTKQVDGRCYFVTLQKHWESLESILTSLLTSHLGYINQSVFPVAFRALKHARVSRDSMALLRALFFELWLRDVTKRGVISIPHQTPQTVAEDFPLYLQPNRSPSRRSP